MVTTVTRDNRGLDVARRGPVFVAGAPADTFVSVGWEHPVADDAGI